MGALSGPVLSRTACWRLGNQIIEADRAEAYEGAGRGAGTAGQATAFVQLFRPAANTVVPVESSTAISIVAEVRTSVV